MDQLSKSACQCVMNDNARTVKTRDHGANFELADEFVTQFKNRIDTLTNVGLAPKLIKLKTNFK